MCSNSQPIVEPLMFGHLLDEVIIACCKGLLRVTKGAK